MRRQLLKTGISWLALLAFMGLFRPSGLPVVVLIVPFLLLFVACLNLWVSLQLLHGRYFTRNQQASKHRRLGVTVCGSVVLLMILQSLGQLTLRDAGTVAAIAVIGYVYMVRTRSRASP